MADRQRISDRAAAYLNTSVAALRRHGGTRAWMLANLIVALLYFALGAVVSAFFAAYGLFPAPIWLPAAVAVVAALAGEFRVLPGIFVGSFAVNALLFAPPLLVTTIISVTNGLGPVLGAVMLRLMRPEKGVFTSLSGVILFLFCTTLLSPAISATGGTVAISIGQPIDWQRTYSIWVAWWLCDSGGTLYLAPALILWLGLERDGSNRGSVRRRFDRRHVMVWTAVALFSLVLFLTPPLHGSYIRQAFPFLLVVPLSWIALRMSLRWAYTLISLVAVTAAAGTVAGFGPFQGDSLANPLQLVGTLVVLLAMNVLTIVALVSERQEALQKNQVKSMFLANTSHELRTPLNAILGFSSAIGSQALGPITNEKYADYAGLIHSAGEHLLALINGLLDLSKIEAGQFALSESRFPLDGAIGEAIALVDMQARAKGVELKTDTTTDGMAIAADANLFRQILLNLLSNAVKFTPTGGTVTVTAARADDGGLVLRVRDTGIGIPDDAIARIFVPFERAHRDGAPIEGTGLGLSITRGLLALHGGSIALESTLGTGTTAIVTLPASRIVPIEMPEPLTELAA